MVKKDSRFSTIKPEAQQKPWHNMTWNEGDRKAYTDIGLEAPDNLNQFQLQFLNDVDIRKMPVQRNVLSMVRLRAPDYTEPGPKYPTKEFIYYQEQWEGRNTFDQPIYMRNDYFEGVYTKRYLKPEMNQLTGEMENVLNPNKRQLIYTIPWNKKNVDEIIAKSTTTDKDSIRFIIKFSSNDSTEFGYNARMPSRSHFSYEQFATWPWEDVYNFHVAPVGNFWDRKAKQYKTIGAQVPVQTSAIT